MTLVSYHSWCFATLNNEEPFEGACFGLVPLQATITYCATVQAHEVLYDI
jgi:hypothetical protein